MKKKLRVTLEIEVADLTAEQRKEMMEGVGFQTEPLPRLKDTSAEDIADVLAHFTPETTAELFGGSDLYVQFMDSKVVEAAFVNG